MKFVGERVDHRNVGIRGHLFENALVVYARDNALHPAIEVASDIGDRLARAERGGGLRVVQENHGATHALDTDFKSDTRAKRGLLKNEGDKFALQCRGVAAGASLYVSREMEEFARVHGTPFASSEEVIRQRNGRHKSGSGHVFTLPRIARSAADSRRLALGRRKWIWEFLRERARTAGEIRELGHA